MPVYCILQPVPLLGVLVKRQVVPQWFAGDVVRAHLFLFILELSQGACADIFVDGFPFLIHADLNPALILSGAVFLRYVSQPCIR